MRCLKSFSVHQKDSQPSSVYTAHVHPHGNWLATGGADNHVKIWDLPRMLARTSIAQIPHDVDAVVHDSLLPRCPPAALPERALVALLAKHSKAVNCVKWSSIGQYLASGSDDSLILLWEAQGVSSSACFDKNYPPADIFQLHGCEFRRFVAMKWMCLTWPGRATAST
mmetsp:Transcript_2634/g.8817  ORF Transcript_2634/g.8817 Transcript_2634/m.8817 type:complete len:168 (+) Transcript_2634:79-582(+)